ncbi:hypothetical protein So717_36800 [Roseobacter cerasinus]|uniref:Uncharacterized protein n=2 Tax=Roseobacter cerasinus TaxID=2602289 RepID=A0A640VVQ1_9RHOB|nr:hypothetical protein So717_36800 [Roseobacter cerasinus]
MANRSKTLGSFTPLTRKLPNTRYSQTKDLVEAAREQRFNYVLLVRMYPSTGAADVMLLHAGSGGVMATATAVSPSGGQRGFWGGQIRNPARLERATLKIAKAAMPLVEDTLRGATMRQ